MNKSQTNTQKICEILVSSLDPPQKNNFKRIKRMDDVLVSFVIMWNLKHSENRCCVPLALYKYI